MNCNGCCYCKLRKQATIRAQVFALWSNWLRTVTLWGCSVEAVPYRELTRVFGEWSIMLGCAEPPAGRFRQMNRWKQMLPFLLPALSKRSSHRLLVEQLEMSALLFFQLPLLKSVASVRINVELISAWPTGNSWTCHSSHTSIILRNLPNLNTASKRWVWKYKKSGKTSQVWFYIRCFFFHFVNL